MVQARKEQTLGNDLDAQLENIMREVDSLPPTALPSVLRKIADRMDQQAVFSPAVTQDGKRKSKRENGPRAEPNQRAALHNALVILTKHQLDHSDSADEDTLLEAQRVMLNALREGKLNRETIEQAEQEVERILVEQGKLTPEQTLSMGDDEESPLVRRALTRPDKGLPVPTDEELEQWRDEYLMEKYGR